MTDTEQARALLEALKVDCGCNRVLGCPHQYEIATAVLSAAREAGRQEAESRLSGLVDAVGNAQDDAERAEAEVARLTDALSRWVRQFDGQTEPVPPVYWAIELRESKELLATLGSRQQARTEGR